MIRKVYEVDPLTCIKCGGTMKIIAFLTARAVVDRIIDHLKLTFVADKPPRQALNIFFNRLLPWGEEACRISGTFGLSEAPGASPLVSAPFDIRRRCDLSSLTMGRGKTGARTLILVGAAEKELLILSQLGVRGNP
jgi:hypothetical protein